MRNFLAALFCLFFLPVFSQTPSDSTIYAVADTMPIPLFASCLPNKHPGWNWDSVRRCGEVQLLALVAQNIRYPQEARDKNIQGMVVTSFVVEQNGRSTNHKILKDIGSGCGEEAIRVLKALDEAGFHWVPGIIKGKPVRTQISLPLRFRLEEAKPYIITESGDSVFVQFEKAPAFKTGDEALARHIVNNVEYPKNFLDSCKTGVIEMSVLVSTEGNASVENTLDFNNLGNDFQFNAIRFVNRTKGMWEPAVFENRPVQTMLTLRLPFKSPAAGCQTANENFDKAHLLSDEAVKLADAEKTEEALAKINDAIVLQPRNTEFLYYRANLQLGLQKNEEACKDFSEIRKILGFTWFESFARLVCGW